MKKTYRPYEPKQSFLLPPSPLDWLPDGHLARFILDVVERLNLCSINAYYEREQRGYPPHHPQMMVALLLYGYCVGVASSRKIEKRTHEDVAFRVIAGNTHPDHTCISEFRRIHLNALAELFLQVLRLCQKAGLVKLGHVAIDGTKLKANASKHKAMSYERMKKDDEKLRQKVSELLRAAEQADSDEDAQYGNRRGDELPDELQRAEDRRERIQQLMAELEAEAAAQHESSPPDDDDDEPPSGPARLPSHKIPAEKDGTPKPKAQRNFTDGDSRIMKSGDSFIQGYNCQTAVDEAHQIIVAQAVTNQPPDVEHLIPMIDRIVFNCGEAPRNLSADNGYLSEANVVGALQRGVDPHIATGRRPHGEPPPTVRGRPPADLTLKQSMARKLATRRGAAVYARRKVIVEPPFGQIKQARGFRQFLLRGLSNVSGEWSLIALTHNLLKLYRALVVVPCPSAALV
ncbi:MAG: IS1182 family transposase [Steroidobacteraceae bacterium]